MKEQHLFNKGCIFFLILAALFSVPAFSAEPEQVYFFDDFEGSLSNKWDFGGDTWQTTDLFCRSESHCISESPTGNYLPNANSIISMKLQERIDLSGSTNPVLTFWHKIGIKSGDHCYVEVSEDYGFNWIEIKSFTNTWQSTWNLVQIDLSEYKKQDIMIRFRLRDDGGTSFGDPIVSWGWDIDDVEIKELDTQTTLEFPFFDDFENGLDPNWLVGGDAWQLTDNFYRDPNYCVSESPIGDYKNNENSSLMLSNPISLTDSNNLVLTFWHKIGIRPGDYCYVEISDDYGFNWTEIKSFTNTWQSTWNLVQIDLSEYKKQDIMIRFRLRDDGGTSFGDPIVSWGWDIDDVEIKELDTQTTLEFPFFDDFENGLDNWIIGGDTWGLSEISYVSHTHSIVDSNDAYYPIRADSSMTLAYPIDLSDCALPVLSFWHKIGIAKNDYCYIEVSQDNGFTWTALDPNQPETGRFTNLTYSSWTSELFNLSAYKSSPILIRFRLRETGNGTASGWDIDDIIIKDLIDPDLFVQITNIDTSSCPTVKATVLVTDNKGLAITGLDESNFFVFENEILQNSFSVDEPNQSCTIVAIALDYSGSMGVEDINSMEKAAIGFVELMEPCDLGEIIKFANGIEVAQELTNDKALLIYAIQKPTSLDRNYTKFFDAIYQGIEDIKNQTGKKAIIAISDGIDTLSPYSATQVIQAAEANNVSVFTIGFGDEINEDVLNIISERTGGLYYYAPNSEALEAIYMAISETLNNMYLISYETSICGSESNNDIENELEIEVTSGLGFGQDIEYFTCPADCDPNQSSE